MLQPRAASFSALFVVMGSSIDIKLKCRYVAWIVEIVVFVTVPSELIWNKCIVTSIKNSFDVSWLIKTCMLLVYFRYKYNLYEFRFCSLIHCIHYSENVCLMVTVKHDSFVQMFSEWKYPIILIFWHDPDPVWHKPWKGRIKISGGEDVRVEQSLPMNPP